MAKPNLDSAYYRFNESTLVVEVFALRSIEAGEEISFSCKTFSSPAITWLIGTDVPLELPQARRAAALRDHWGFDCSCAACTAPPEAIADSDERVEEIVEIQDTLGSAAANPKELLGLLEKLLKLYDEEGIISPKPKYYEIAAYAANQLGDEDAAKSYAHMAARYWSIVAGPKSWDVWRVEDLLRDPKEHPSWRYKVDL